MHSANHTMTPYPDLNAVLRELVDGAQAVLGQHFIAAYLQGSFAVGDFDAHSDVDFTMVVEDELPTAQVDALQAMHARLYGLDCAWAQHLEGSYFPRAVLKRPPQDGERLWFLDNGSRALVQSTHCNTRVVRWVVREKGIALAGPSPAALIEPVSAEALREEIRATIRDWGQEILADTARYNNRFYQSFIVLSYCRMWHSLHIGAVASKRAGAEWAKANLDSAWAGLIDRTWAGRPQPEVSVRQPADPDDFASTLRFVRHIIDLSQE